MQTYAIEDCTRILDRSWSSTLSYTIHDLPNEDRPRQKLLASGPEALTVRELLAVVLNTGTSKEDVLEMSNRIIREYGEKSLLSERDALRLSEDLSIPLVKACQVVAVGELGRRHFDRNKSGFTTIRNAEDVYEYLQDMRNLPKEHLRGLYLNSHNRIIRDEVISIGTVNSSIFHPREVFHPAIESNAAAVVLAHNHPSGEMNPSKEDIEITQQIIQAGKILGISVLDHVIITSRGFKSVIKERK